MVLGELTVMGRVWIACIIIFIINILLLIFTKNKNFLRVIEWILAIFFGVINLLFLVLFLIGPM